MFEELLKNFLPQLKIQITGEISPEIYTSQINTKTTRQY